MGNHVKTVLGIDPGSLKTGYGIVQKSGNQYKHIENGTLYLEKEKNYLDKLTKLYQEIMVLIEKYHIDSMAIEDIFYYKNPRSVQKLSEVRGVALLCGGLKQIEVSQYTPLQVKQAVTGYGKATKDQVQVMICKILGLKDRPEENASDGLAIALCHSQLIANPIHEEIKQNQKQVKNVTRQELLKQANFYK